MAETEMVERVARAIYEKRGDNQGGYALTFDQINLVRQECFRLEARAAIEAMREATDAERIARQRS